MSPAVSETVLLSGVLDFLDIFAGGGHPRSAGRCAARPRRCRGPARRARAQRHHVARHQHRSRRCCRPSTSRCPRWRCRSSAAWAGRRDGVWPGNTTPAGPACASGTAADAASKVSWWRLLGCEQDVQRVDDRARRLGHRQFPGWSAGNSTGRSFGAGRSPVLIAAHEDAFVGEPERNAEIRSGKLNRVRRCRSSRPGEQGDRGTRSSRPAGCSARRRCWRVNRGVALRPPSAGRSRRSSRPAARPPTPACRPSVQPGHLLDGRLFVGQHHGWRSPLAPQRGVGAAIPADGAVVPTERRVDQPVGGIAAEAAVVVIGVPRVEPLTGELAPEGVAVDRLVNVVRMSLTDWPAISSSLPPLLSVTFGSRVRVRAQPGGGRRRLQATDLNGSS